MVNLSTELYNLFDSDGSHIVNFLEWLAKTYDLPTELDILDVGCGPGRTLQPMAARKWRVVAMEPNIDYHEEAARIASELDAVTVMNGGFGEIAQEHAYDMIVAINAPFTYLLSIEERVDALRRIHTALKPNGVVFLDMPNFLAILKNYETPHPSLTESPSGDLIRRQIEHDIDFHACTFTHTDLFYVNDELKDQQVHKMAIMTPQEAQYLLKQANFGEMMTFNGFGARENQHLHSIRMMVAARKL